MSRGVVTRSVRTLCVNGLFADIKNNSIIKKEIIVPYRNLSNKNTVERYVRKIYNDPDYKLISIESWEEKSTLYGCTEELFLQFAEPYSKLNRKPIEKEN